MLYMPLVYSTYAYFLFSSVGFVLDRSRKARSVLITVITITRSLLHGAVCTLTLFDLLVNPQPLLI